ncbi:MAG: nicotinate-nucleotide adenylyltransferase [Lachnospiraceae bacterium]
MRIGIMGGTFDPIHNGHLMLGRAALTQYALDEVWFMPNGNPPHKGNITAPIEARCKMTELAIEGTKKFRLELYEADDKSVSYSYKTLEHFYKTRKSDKFYFIIGADSLFMIESWVKPERIFPVCTLLAACRDEISTPEKMLSQIRCLEKKYGAGIRILKAPLMPVSSHELRERIRSGKSFSNYVPAKVAEYIKKEGLYGAQNQ